MPPSGDHTSTAPNGSATETEVWTRFSLLGNERRYRSLVQVTTKSDDAPLQVGAVADALADEMADADDTRDGLRTSIYISLCQSHLPKLAKHGFVVYDPDEQTVGPGPELDEIEPYLDGGGEPAWRPYAVGAASVIASGIAGAIVLGLPVAWVIGPVLVLGLNLLIIALLLLM